MIRSAINSAGGAILDEPYHYEWVRDPPFPDYWDGKTDPADWLVQRCNDGLEYTVCGALLHFHQSAWWPGLRERLRDLRPRVVILYRRDLLAQWASYHLANKTDVWDTYPGHPPATDTLTPDWSELEDWCGRFAASVYDDLSFWRACPHLPIAYEDAAADLQRTINQIAVLCHGTLPMAEPSTVRREHRPLWDVVTDYQTARAVTAKYALPF